MILKEFESLQCKDEAKPHFIKEETFLALEKFVLDNEESAQYLKITTKKGLGKVLQAQNYVGLIQTKDGTTIEILPKIQNIEEDKAKEILIKMLKTLKKSPFKNVNTAHLKSTKMPLLEIFITMFLEELAVLVRKGIKSDYITKEENLPFLKGKLKVGEQIKKNSIHKERFYVEYQEFLSDRAENRLIKTTLHYLYKKSHATKNQQRIREFLFVFDEISLCKDIKNDFLHVKPNRQMKEYEQILLWCKTFLLENAFSPHKGDDIAFALLFDMNLLFESYVGAYLKKKGLHVSLQDTTHHLAYENDHGRFRLKPDILIYDKDELLIADTKWKILSEDKAHEGIAQSDMYQLYAYGTKYKNCKKMYLIYPKTSEIQSRRFVYKVEEDTFLVLNTLFFDLENNCFEKKDKEYRLFELIGKI
ncbi:MAG: restriction endonuclease [Epsilonproteobacteria bacterium]|nr:restriction endonuclease [Campylobacterota bacterium]